MKKPAPVILYPGVVLHSSGMIVIPQIPRPQSQVRLPRLITAVQSVSAPRQISQAKRK